MELVVFQLTVHSFIAKSQALYLKNKKKKQFSLKLQLLRLIFQKIIPLFRMRYKVTIGLKMNALFILFLFMLKTRKVCSFCFMSENLNHDPGFVYAFQQIVTNNINENFPAIKVL